MSLAEMPKVGLGLWKIPKEQCAEAVYDAISLGYRHLDSACDYGNEEEVGEGIRKAIEESLCTREELWVTSKLWNTYHSKQHVKPALLRSLNDLGLAYLDLYLIHFPIALKYVDFEKRYPPEWVYDPAIDKPCMHSAPIPLQETWAAMEDLVAEGLVKKIGVCNYNTGLVHDLMSYAEIKPAMLQIESHPYLTQENVIRLCKDYDIDVTAYSPLGSLSYVELDMADSTETVLQTSTVAKVAARTGKSPAQVVLRWNIQRGCAVIPKSASKDHLKQNVEVFDFSLTETEMAEISALNCGRRFNDPGKFCESAFNTFYPIYD